MLPHNIDLTENGDFGIGGGIFMDTPIEIPMDEFHLMTPEQYDKLMWWEGIFGRRRHYMEKSKIFNTEEKFKTHWEHHCLRCGVELRIPWNIIGGCCGECDEIVTHRIIPWRENHMSIHDGRRNPKYDLFNSR